LKKQKNEVELKNNIKEMAFEIKCLRRDKLKLEQEKKDIPEKNSGDDKIKSLLPSIM